MHIISLKQKNNNKKIIKIYIECIRKLYEDNMECY